MSASGVILILLMVSLIGIILWPRLGKMHDKGKEHFDKINEQDEDHCDCGCEHKKEDNKDERRN